MTLMWKIFLAPVLLLLFSCNMGSSFSDEFSLEDGKQVLKKAKFDRVLIDSTGEMQVFASMNKTDELSKETDLQFMDTFKELYLMVIKESIADFEFTLELDSATYMKNVKDSSSTFAIYSEFITHRMKGNLNTATDSMVIKKTSHDMPLRIYSLEGEVKNMKIFYQVGFIKGKEQLYQVIIWTQAKRKNLYEGVMRKMIESLEEY